MRERQSLPQTTGDRIAWVDVAKALGIILVFHGHLVEPFIRFGDPAGEYRRAALQQMRWIYAFHMPLFFLLVGFLYKDRGLSLSSFVIRQVRTRLVPAWVFNIVALLMWLGEQLATGESRWVQEHDWTALARHCLGKTLAMFYQGRHSWNVLTWFLFCLFTVELGQFCLRRFSRRTWQVAVCLAVFAGLATAADYYADTLYALLGVRRHWWHITSALAALTFYQLGLLLRRLGLFSRPGGPLPRVLGCLLCLTVLMLTYNRNPGLETNVPAVVLMIDAKYGHMGWFFPSAIAGSLFIVYASQLLASSRVLTYLGQITLALMCLDGLLHGYFNPPLAKLLIQLMPQQSAWTFTLLGVLITLVSLAACVPINWLLERYLPFLLGRARAGKRPASHAGQAAATS